jgi:putative intracellular protease/amidase
MMSRSRLALLSAAVGLTIAFAAVAADSPAPPAKKVAIVIFDGVQIIDYSGPYEVFADAGYDVFTVGATKDPVTTAAGDGIKLTPKYSFADAPQADVIVIPGGGYEAPPGSPTVEWIKRETVHAEHTMSVCNGAFTLAATGLLDGLRATTTAGNIVRFGRSFPSIKVINDERVVDNGKIIATAGLSAGIDGALHLLEKMEGKEAAQSVALWIEYDWRPNSGFVRGVMADRLIARPTQAEWNKIGEITGFRIKGDRDHWEIIRRLTSKLSGSEISTALKAAFEKAYALEGPWRPGSFKAVASGPLLDNLDFDDRDSHHWKGTLTVEPDSANANNFTVRFVTRRSDG